ncbi:hypothetical protein DPMN_179863 [Dreissena polymorpha]|uniref:Uncharacterized protein n=1 Tax=Dreissena polymorpha TaxID=45954 RepID=A0A9D4EGZ9_DREPO|nr:hypothetical protein DPMN_179863 [Dreissena polymorpha]
MKHLNPLGSYIDSVIFSLGVRLQSPSDGKFKEQKIIVDEERIVHTYMAILYRSLGIRKIIGDEKSIVHTYMAILYRLLGMRKIIGDEKSIIIGDAKSIVHTYMAILYRSLGMRKIIGDEENNTESIVHTYMAILYRLLGMRKIIGDEVSIVHTYMAIQFIRLRKRLSHVFMSHSHNCFHPRWSNGDTISLRINGDTISLRINGETISLRINGDTISLRINGDTISLRLNGDTISLRINGDTKSLRINYIIRTNVETKFHEDWNKTVTPRLLTRLYYRTNNAKYRTNVLTSFHEDKAINVAHGVSTRFNYSHIPKTAPPSGEHSSIKFGSTVKMFYFIRKTAWPPGCHVFQRTATIFDFSQESVRKDVLIKF